MKSELEKIKELENELLKTRLLIQELEREKEEYNKKANVYTFIWVFLILGGLVITYSREEGNRILLGILTAIIVVFFIIWLINTFKNYFKFGQKINLAKKKKKTARKGNRKIELFGESQIKKTRLSMNLFSLAPNRF